MSMVRVSTGARAVAWLAAVTVLAGCSSSVSNPDDLGTGASEIVDTNGLNQNGLNQNGLNQNSLSTNSLTQNGLNQNGLNQNGLNQNGLNQNGLNQNGLNQNGLNQNGLNQNGLTQTALLEDPNAREFLQYVYSCAMPEGASMQLVVDGVDFGTLYGSVGLAPEWGEDGGTCDETCQRWVSACVLARTNAYGKKVSVSMRGSHPALALETGETTSHPVREGAYFGNVFATEPDGNTFIAAPKYYACAGPGSNIPQLTMRFCSGQLDGCPIETLGVCTGAPTGSTPVCDSLVPDETTGHLEGCHGLDAQTYEEVITIYIQAPIAACGNAVCEEGEEGAGTPNAVACPSDCHPGTWARSVDSDASRIANTLGTLTRGSAVAADGSVVLTGAECDEIDLGGPTPLPAETPGGVDQNCGFLAKLDADGTHLWSARIHGGLVNSVAVGPSGEIAIADTTLFNNGRIQWFDPNGELLGSRTFDGTDGVQASRALAFDAAGNIVFAGQFHGTLTLGEFTMVDDDPDNSLDVFVGKLAPTNSGGDVLWAESFPTTNSDFAHDLAVDLDGNVLVSIGFGPNMLYKLSGIDGSAIWAQPATQLGADTVIYAIAVDRDDVSREVFVTGTAISTNNFFVSKLSALGDTVWNQQEIASGNNALGNFWGNNVRLTSEGNVLIAGSLLGIADFGAGAFDSFGGGDLFAAQYSRDGAFQWAKLMPMALKGDVDGVGLAPDGRVVVSGRFNGSMVVDNRILINTVPELTTHENLYIAAFAPPCAGDGCDTTPPTIADVPPDLVLQATSSDGATGWFTPPTSTDAELGGTSVFCTPPPKSEFPIGETVVTCTASDAHGNSSSATFTVTVLDRVAPSLFNVPESISVLGTGPTTIVSWPAPTAYDQVDGDRPVTCTPPSGSGFPFGTTTVTCSASDLAGNVFEASFPVHVEYGWGGFQQPINTDGSSVFKLGSTIPVKFVLSGAAAGITDAVATLTYVKIDNGVPGPVNEAVSTSQATTGNTFVYAGGQYQFNLSTKTLTKGTYELRVDLGDGLLHTVRVALK